MRSRGALIARGVALTVAGLAFAIPSPGCGGGGGHGGGSLPVTSPPPPPPPPPSPPPPPPPGSVGGAVPATLPKTFLLGLANEPGDQSWMQGSGVAFDARYTYLAGG